MKKYIIALAAATIAGINAKYHTIKLDDNRVSTTCTTENNPVVAELITCSNGKTVDLKKNKAKITASNPCMLSTKKASFDVLCEDEYDSYDLNATSVKYSAKK